MKVGFVAGAFDLLHAGHIHLFKEAKKKCNVLIVGLHIDPSIDRADKNKPIESVLERTMKLKACRYVDVVIVYEKESDIPLIFQFFDVKVRFLGSDYIDQIKPITAKDAVPIEYINSLPIHTADIRKKL